MICAHCKAVHHICPTCGEHGTLEHSRAERGYSVYECGKGHRWHEIKGEVVDLRALRRTLKAQRDHHV